MRLSLPLLVLLPALLHAGRAGAYVRMNTAAGSPVRWTQSCVLMTADVSAPAPLGPQDLDQTMRRAIDNWDRATGGCSGLSLTALPAGARQARVDGTNSVVFQTVSWGRNGASYDPSALAITTVTYADVTGSPDYGAILDADIELNAIGVEFVLVGSTTDPGGDPGAAPSGKRQQDLENTLTHELGHVQGLGHNCQEPSTPLPPLDQDGMPVPPCDTEVPAVVGATMFPYAMDRETGKRTVGDDDAQGICGPYPKTAPLAPCEQSVRGGCSAVLGGEMGGGGGLVVVLFVMGWRVSFRPARRFARGYRPIQARGRRGRGSSSGRRR